MSETLPPGYCDDPECGCKTPFATEPIEALRFLSARFKHAGVAEAVADHYARDIDAILAKHDAGLAAVAGWMPIESAPKDGTLVLTFRWLRGQPNINTTCWRQCVSGEWAWGGDGWSFDATRCAPTHWMPLPPAPAEPA